MNCLRCTTRGSSSIQSAAAKLLSYSRWFSVQSFRFNYKQPFLQPGHRSIPHFTAQIFEDCHGRTAVELVSRALRAKGIAIINLNFPDPMSNYLHHLVLNLGKYHNHGPLIRHSGSRGWFWDVRPTSKTGPKARSEGSIEFPWHTDCSYESCPPNFFGLHVLHADRNGGGTLSALNVHQLLQKLSPLAHDSFSRPDFRITVPPEFYKGSGHIEGNLITGAQENNNLRIRYRSDIMQGLSSRAGEALAELNALLAPDSKALIEDLRIDLTSQNLPDNAIVLMDNGRWLHSRSDVRDPQRHLRRISWDRREFQASDRQYCTQL